MVWWLVGVGAAFGASTALGDVFLPMAIRHWGAGASVTALVALLAQWAGTGNEVAAIGMIGLFPSGRPERGYERVVIWTAAVVAVLLPLLDAVSAANIALAEVPGQALPVVRSGVSLTVLAPLRGAFGGVPVLSVLDRGWRRPARAALLQGKATERRQIALAADRRDGLVQPVGPVVPALVGSRSTEARTPTSSATCFPRWP